MKKVIIGEFIFNLKSEWEDISLSDFVAICKIKMPQKLLAMYMNAEDKEKWEAVFNEVTYEDNEKNFPEYFGKLLAILSDIPQPIIDLIQADQRTELFNQYLFPFAYSSVTDYPVILNEGKSELYQPKEMKTVKYKGQTYYFPETLNINGLDSPLANEEIISFTEASSIMTTWNKLSEHGAEYAAMIPAIYLRKKNEKYSEKLVMERKKLFEGLSMDVVWSLFFYIIGRAVRSMSDTLSSSMESEPTRNKRLQVKVV